MCPYQEPKEKQKICKHKTCLDVDLTITLHVVKAICARFTIYKSVEMCSVPPQERKRSGNLNMGNYIKSENVFFFCKLQETEMSR